MLVKPVFIHVVSSKMLPGKITHNRISVSISSVLLNFNEAVVQNNGFVGSLVEK